MTDNCGCVGDQCELGIDGVFRVVKKKKNDNLRTK